MMNSIKNVNMAYTLDKISYLFDDALSFCKAFLQWLLLLFELYLRSFSSSRNSTLEKHTTSGNRSSYAGQGVKLKICQIISKIKNILVP